MTAALTPIAGLAALLLLASSSTFATARRELRAASRQSPISGPSAPTLPPSAPSAPTRPRGVEGAPSSNFSSSSLIPIFSKLPASSLTGRVKVPPLPYNPPSVADSPNGLTPAQPPSPSAPMVPTGVSKLSYAINGTTTINDTNTETTLLPVNSKDSGEYFGDWYTARGTNYGSPEDGWSIMKGSCQYYNLWGNHATGWDVAAMADANIGYAGSCGGCYEVKCLPMWVQDGYGQEFDRTGVCYDTAASVVVMITDTCPCYYPENAYSNKRWCCGDEQHFDLSVWTFQKLANLEWGVMGLSVRQVPCGYQVQQTAWMQPWAVYPEGFNNIPTNWKDRRPWPYNTPATAKTNN